MSLAPRFVATIADRVRSAPAAQDDARALHRWVNDTEHLVLGDLLSPEEESEVVALADRAVLERSQDLFCTYESVIEKSVAALMHSGELHVIDSPANVTQNYRQRYQLLAANEIRLARMKQGDRVLFVGSGPLPITAIEYARQAGCRVDCVDHLLEAIDISTAIVARLGLADVLRPIHARGQECDVSGYDVILVGVLAQPKRDILSRIDALADPGTRLLCRTTTGVRQFIYPRTQPMPMKRFNPAGFSRARMDQALSTQLLTADGSLGAWEVSSAAG